MSGQYATRLCGLTKSGEYPSDRSKASSAVKSASQIAASARRPLNHPVGERFSETPIEVRSTEPKVCEVAFDALLPPFR
jgi:hypothetical protein